MKWHLWDRVFIKKVLPITDCSNSNFQRYLRSINSRDCVIPFCRFSAAIAHWLATHVSICRNEQRKQWLQANVELCDNNTVLWDGFMRPKCRFSNYIKRHWYRATSFIKAPRTQYNDEEPGDTSQLRNDNESIPTSQRDKTRASDLEKQLSGCSMGMQSDSYTHLLLPDQLQGIIKGEKRKPRSKFRASLDQLFSAFTVVFLAFDPRFELLWPNLFTKFLFKKTLNWKWFSQLSAL